jgi:hypothetical protein
LPPFYAEPTFYQYLATWAVFTACLLFYGLRSPWRESSVGKAMVTLYGSLVAILTLVLLILVGLIPEGQPRDLLRTLTLGGMTLAGAVQLAAILRLQRRDRKTNSEHQGDAP